MAIFQYKAATRDGEVVVGTLEGQDSEAVIALIQAQGQVPIRVERGETRGRKTGRGRLHFQRGGRVGREDIAAFTHELCTLLSAGVSLDRALGVIEELSPKPALQQLVKGVRERVRQGQSLADALQGCEGVFNTFYVNLVRAGEAGGALESTLRRLGDHLARTQALRESITAALIYPVILVLVAIGAVLLLLTYVVPQFAQLFADVGQALPLPTRVVIASGEFLQHYGWLLPLLVVGLAALGERLLRRPQQRLRVHRWLLVTPLLGDLIERLETARFARTLATLLGNGVTLVEALRLARKGVGNLEIGARLQVAEARVSEGRRLAEQLREQRAVPPFAVQMVSVGEESGELESMLLRVADAYEAEVQRSLKRMLAILEPAMILLLGALVAGIVLSILVAILGINQLVF